MATSQALIDANTHHQIYVQRLSTTQSKKVLPYLKEASAIVNKILSGYGEFISETQRDRIYKQVRDELKQVYYSWNDELTTDLSEFGVYEAGFQQKTVGAVLVNAEPTAPSKSVLNGAALALRMPIEQKGTISLRKMLNQFPIKESKRAAQQIIIGQAAGLTTAQISRQVSGVINGLSKSNSFSLTKTAMQAVSSTAKDEFYKENDDLIIGYRWISTLDNKTTTQCMALDQRVFLNSSNEPKIIPPIHYGERSTTTPELNGRYSAVIKSGDRPSLGAGGVKQVGAKEDYYTFMRRQPAEWQDEAFGGGKIGRDMGKAFRSSGLTNDQFSKAAIDAFGQPLDLAQMAAKDAKLAAYVATL